MKRPSALILGTLIIFCVLLLLKLHNDSRFYDHKLRQTPGGMQLRVAEDFIHANEVTEFSGNTHDAVELARYFSIELPSRGKEISTIKTVPTYCFVRNDAFVILTLMPGMNYFPDIKKREVEDIAWTLATDYALLKHPELKKAAICFMSNRKYVVLLIGQDAKRCGRIASETDAQARMIVEQLMPFFVPYK